MFFAIITSHEMTAREALELYKSRDGFEKLFRGDKSYLGNRSLSVHSEDVLDVKIFIEFMVFIICNRMYCMLKDEMAARGQRANYMTVPAALKELEKIEMIRHYDGRYRLDHAVTKTQKTIPKAFVIDANQIRDKAEKISNRLKYVEEEL